MIIMNFIAQITPWLLNPHRSLITQEQNTTQPIAAAINLKKQGENYCSALKLTPNTLITVEHCKPINSYNYIELAGRGKRKTITTAPQYWKYYSSNKETNPYAPKTLLPRDSPSLWKYQGEKDLPGSPLNKIGIITTKNDDNSCIQGNWPAVASGYSIRKRNISDTQLHHMAGTTAFHIHYICILNNDKVAITCSNPPLPTQQGYNPVYKGDSGGPILTNINGTNVPWAVTSALSNINIIPYINCSGAISIFSMLNENLVDILTQQNINVKVTRITPEELGNGSNSLAKESDRTSKPLPEIIPIPAKATSSKQHPLETLRNATAISIVAALAWKFHKSLSEINRRNDRINTANINL
jgi:hypothetical protein